MLNKMVTKHRAGEFVPGGIYWSRKTWDLTQIPEEGAHLPAAEGDVCYYQLPLLLVMALGPVAGLAFILFLPVAVPLVILYSIPRAIAAAIRRRRAAKGGFRPAGMHR